MFGWTGVFVLIVVTLPVDACLVTVSAIAGTTVCLAGQVCLFSLWSLFLLMHVW